MKLVINIFIVLIPYFLWAQDLNENTYETLEANIKNSTSESIKKAFSNEYLLKAKKENDLLKISSGYLYVSRNVEPLIAIKYTDSIISLTSKISHKEFPARAYIVKGNLLYELGDMKAALKEYLNALRFSKKNKNKEQSFIVNFNIGLLKNAFGEREEAKVIFKKSYDIVNQREGKKYRENYDRVLYALADSYMYDKKLDSAEMLTKKGLYKAIKNKDIETYTLFLQNFGITSFFQNKYHTAIDSLQKSHALFAKENEEKTRLAITSYYIGKSYMSLSKNDLAMNYFREVDSILNITNDITPELIDTYKHLIKNAQQKNKLDEQIHHVASLIKYDSILDNNYKYLKNTIFKTYEVPELVSEKQKLIKQLEDKQTNSKQKIIVILISLLLTVIVLSFFICKNYSNKKKYQNILRSINEKQLVKETLIEKKSTDQENNIPKEIINSVLEKLESFEMAKKYTLKKYTLQSLAKELNTNSSYLSKIINTNKGYNFSNYLNNLRVDYSIEKLASDKQFRSYTIKAIAEEVGFNNAQSFSTAFYKKTGVYPSYFIKKIKADKDKEIMTNL